MKTNLIIFFLMLSRIVALSQDNIRVPFTEDFDILCADTNSHFNKAEWNTLAVEGTDERSTRMKLMYSRSGIYFLFANEDKQITATRTKDFDSLWLEDVAEVFLWPDTSITMYMEYEISPLNRELVLFIAHVQGKFAGWTPFGYSGKKQVRHCTDIIKDASGVKAWYASFFIPYRLLYPLVQRPPRKGTVWRANFFRSDRDRGKTVEWSWKKTIKSFHEYHQFGRLVFE